MVMNHLTIPAPGLKIPSIAQVMKKTCDFQRYENGKLWYSIYWTEPCELPEHLKGHEDRWTASESSVFEFPIPVDDAGAGAFEPYMRAINLMRWIRKHIEFLTNAKQDAVHG
jgi:hypothetical protein